MSIRLLPRKLKEITGLPRGTMQKASGELWKRKITLSLKHEEITTSFLGFNLNRYSQKKTCLLM